jgi:hypothetical protein
LVGWFWANRSARVGDWIRVVGSGLRSGLVWIGLGLSGFGLARIREAEGSGVFYVLLVVDATCSRCGRSKAAAAPVEALAWVSERQGERMTWLCPACARTHVRDIEGKLPEEYW